MSREVRLWFTPDISHGSHGSFTAICREVDLAASGDSENDARDRLRVIMASYCNALQRNGLLEKALRESGIRYESVVTADGEECVDIAIRANQEGGE